MKTTFTALLVFLATASSCGPATKSADNPRDERSAATVDPAKSGFLTRIPADTPYVWATLERWPRAYWEWAYLSRAADYQHAVSLLNKAMAAEPDAMTEMDDSERLLFAFLSELDGHLDMAGLRKLGLTIETQIALYGVGLYPVLRLELADGSRFRKLIGRVIARANFGGATTGELGDVSYWRVDSEDFSIVLGVVGNEALLTMAPPTDMTEQLPKLLGVERPARSLADSDVLPKIARANKFLPNGIGFFEPTRLGAALREHGLLPKDCLEDVDALFAALPRVVFGFREIEDRMRAALVAELPPSVVEELRSSAVYVPGIARADRKGVYAGIAAGARLRPLLAAVTRYVSGIASATGTCKSLAPVRDVVAELGGIAAQLDGSALEDVYGVSLIATRLSFDMTQIRDVAGYAFVAGNLDKLLPQAAMLGVPASLGDQPTAVDMSTVLPPVVGKVHMARAGDRLGVSFGLAGGGKLADHMTRVGGSDDPLVVLRTNGETLAALNLEAHRQESMDIAQIDPELAEALVALDQGDQLQYGAMDFALSITSTGVAFELDVEYNKPTPAAK